MCLRMDQLYTMRARSSSQEQYVEILQAVQAAWHEDDFDTAERIISEKLARS